MVSQSSSVGYTIMGKTADLTVVQKTTIDTLHKEGKTQKVIAKAFRMPWRSSAECAAITLSSAYCNFVIVVQLTLLLALNLLRLKSLPSVLYMIGIPCGSSSPMRWSMAAMKIANSVGAMTHPCLSPVSTIKGSDLEPPLLSTVTAMPSYRSLSILIYMS